MPIVLFSTQEVDAYVEVDEVVYLHFVSSCPSLVLLLTHWEVPIVLVSKMSSVVTRRSKNWIYFLLRFDLLQSQPSLIVISHILHQNLTRSDTFDLTLIPITIELVKGFTYLLQCVCLCV